MNPTLILWLVTIGIIGLAVLFAWMESKKK